MKGLISIILLTCGVFLSNCQQSEKLGSRDNPVKLYFTPSVDAETMTSNAKDFIRFLEKETGLFFKSGIPTSYIAVVEAFGSKRADIGVMNSFGYIMANEKYGAIAKLRVIRYGHDYYQGQIIAHVDSKIKTLADIQGKRFAFTDPSSTSGHMFPLKMLQDNNVVPAQTVFANKHDNVVISVYQRQVDAGATYYSAPGPNGEIRDARARVKTQFPDVEDKVKIIATTDKIPNDPFVFRKDLPEEITSKFIAGLKKYIQTPEGKKIFKDIYSVDGVVETNDQSYDILRKMIKAINLDVIKHLK